MMSRLGEAIRKYRTLKGMSPKDLAKKLGVAESYILDVEVGRRIVNDVQIERLSKILGVDLNSGLSFYFPEEESKSSKTAPPSPAPAPEKQPKTAPPPAPQWEQAFSSVLKDIPVYNIQMTAVLDTRKLPVLKNKVEGYPPEKIFFVSVPDDSMAGFRLSRGDRVLIHTGGEASKSGLYLIEWKGEKMIRQLKPLDGRHMLLVSQDSSLHTQTVKADEITVIGRCVKAEIDL